MMRVYRQRGKLCIGQDQKPGVKPSNESLLKLLELVLTKNNFQFNGQNYLQTGGTAIGTKAAPDYVINTLGKFEAKYVYT